MKRIARSGALAAVAAAALLGIAMPAAFAQQGEERQRVKQNAPSQKVSIDFAAFAGGKPVNCRTPIKGLGNGNRTARLTDLRFYVSELRLLRKGGGTVPVRLAADSPWRVSSGKHQITLIDLENARGDCADEGTPGMNPSVRGTVPRGQYVGASWVLGVPYALNHTDVITAPAPLNITAMAWSWQVGRKYMKIEVSDAGDGTPWSTRTFFVHLGSTGCSGDPVMGETAGCARPNRHEVTLRGFDPARQRVGVDLEALFAGVDVTANGGGAGGCMSAVTDPECPAIFEALGMKLGSSATTRQSVFRVVGK